MRAVQTLVAALAALVVTAVPAGASGLARLPLQVVEPEPPARGVALVVHGGGWRWTGLPAVLYEAPEARRLAALGWRAVNADYRPGRDAVADAEAWLRWVREAWPGLPVCVLGRSAGAHLALLTAASEPAPDCVLGHAPVTDLEAGAPTLAARRLRTRYVVPAFGDDLRRFSPLARPPRPSVRVLLATSAADRVTPCAQQLEPFARAAGADARCLPAGPAPFVHAGVAPPALAELHAAEAALLRREAASPPPQDPPAQLDELVADGDRLVLRVRLRRDGPLRVRVGPVIAHLDGGRGDVREVAVARDPDVTRILASTGPERAVIGRLPAR